MVQAEPRGTEGQAESTAGDAVPGVGVRKDGQAHDSVTGEPIYGGKIDPEQMTQFAKVVRIELNKDIRKMIGDVFEDHGFYAEAAKVKGTKVEAGVLKRVWNSRITAGHVLIGVGVTGVLWLVYEGIAYAMKDRYKLPSLLRRQLDASPMKKR